MNRAARAAARVFKTPAYSVALAREFDAGWPLYRPAVRMMCPAPLSAAGNVSGFVISAAQMLRPCGSCNAARTGSRDTTRVGTPRP